MNNYQTFVFEFYHFDEDARTISLNYSLDGEVFFTETIVHAEYDGQREAAAAPELSAALFALHLIGGISYYKTFCPRNIEVKSGSLTQEQASFWNLVYENGLGEFFYRNDIDFRGLVNFPWTVEKSIAWGKIDAVAGNRQPRLLVPFGGGKNSIVTVEMLKKQQCQPVLYRVGSHPLISELVKVTGLPLLSAERHLSPELFRLNQQGALNGHVPATAYLSFLAVVSSLLYGFDVIVMSNERSASQGNLTYYGKQINHQWSKSLQFERMIQDYIGRFVSRQLMYVNLLGSLNELEIASLFVKHPQYFPLATSCNANWRLLKQDFEDVGTNRWCGRCPKCAFSFAMFAAFLPLPTLLTMFGNNLFEDPELTPLYRQLLGYKGTKPFECVGTPEETRAAFALACKNKDFETSVACKMWSAGEPASRHEEGSDAGALKDPRKIWS